MLDVMNELLKKSQDKTMYINECSNMCKHTCLALDHLYLDLTQDGANYFMWEKITDLNNPDNYLQFNASKHLCIYVRGYEIQMYL